MENNKQTPNPFMREFDGIYASDAIKQQINYPENSFTLRDHFAGLAMQALIANPQIKRPDEKEKDFEIFSERCYRYADAMLKRRIK